MVLPVEVHVHVPIPVPAPLPVLEVPYEVAPVLLLPPSWRLPYAHVVPTVPPVSASPP